MKFRKARDQVRFGEQHINREPHAQLFAQLRKARSHCGGMAFLCDLILQGQIAEADRYDRTVDRLAFAEFLQKRQKPQPRGIINLRVAFLRGVPPRCVYQHSIVGKPPVAVACAADTADGRFAHLVRKRKLQPGIHNRRRFASPRRADHYVPRQFIQMFAPVL